MKLTTILYGDEHCSATSRGVISKQYATPLKQKRLLNQQYCVGGVSVTLAPWHTDEQQPDTSCNHTPLSLSLSLAQL